MAYIKRGGHGGHRDGAGRKRKPPLSERLSKRLQWEIGALCAEEERRLMRLRADNALHRLLSGKGIDNVAKRISLIMAFGETKGKCSAQCMAKSWLAYPKSRQAARSAAFNVLRWRN